MALSGNKQAKWEQAKWHIKNEVMWSHDYLKVSGCKITSQMKVQYSFYYVDLLILVEDSGKLNVEIVK